jgi:hypothetical protein
MPILSTRMDGGMDTASVLYTACNISQSIKLLIEAIEKYGYSLWSLRGDPAALHFSPMTSALRVSILSQPRDSHLEPPVESIVGTAHLVSVSPIRSRITFICDNLMGEALDQKNREPLFDFYEFFTNFVELKGVVLADVETGGKTRVFGEVNETGPLLA